MPTLRPLWLILDDLSVRMRTAPALAVASDFDGTLTEIVEHAGQAELNPRVRAAIGALAALPDVRVGVFSGRPLSDLVSRMNLPGVFLSGVSGLETQDTHGTRRQAIAEGDAVPTALRQVLGEWCALHPGAWLEDKSVACAVHYRQVPQRLQPAFAAGVRRRLAPYRERLRVLPGKKLFEVLPAAATDKGWALEQWLPAADPALVIFFGDDVHDEVVHPVVRSRGGIAVAVGRTSSRAEFSLPSPRHVLWFLEWLVREWRAVRRPAAPAEAEPHPVS